MEGCVTIYMEDISRECAGLEDEECEDGIIFQNSKLWRKHHTNNEV
jgi:hypothetical protein